ncbi:MAG TPA: hypothetical protein VG318_05405 [Actinomycetota bacterium]|nr:hypothetical protein [Actinomycetota bacterium]
MIAAKATAAHARALPLYYAAMHAAKALSAAYGDDHKPRGHGLLQASRVVLADVMDFEIKPAPGPSVLSTLYDVTESGRLEGPVSLGRLFLSLPDLAEKPHVIAGPRALYLEEVAANRVRDPTLHVVVETGGVAADLWDVDYAELDGWYKNSDDDATVTSRRQPGTLFGRLVDVRDRPTALQELAPTYRFSGARWLIPNIDGTSGRLSPLVTWYALLFGFSILARYEPDTWLAALDVRQQHAVAIEAALEEATAALPELVWKHIGTQLAEERLREKG